MASDFAAETRPMNAASAGSSRSTGFPSKSLTWTWQRSRGLRPAMAGVSSVAGQSGPALLPDTAQVLRMTRPGGSTNHGPSPPG